MSQTAGLAGFVRLGLHVAIAKKDAHVVHNIASHVVCISAFHVEFSHSVEFFKARLRLSFYITFGGNIIDLRLSFAYHQCDP